MKVVQRLQIPELCRRQYLQISSHLQNLQPVGVRRHPGVTPGSPRARGGHPLGHLQNLQPLDHLQGSATFGPPSQWGCHRISMGAPIWGLPKPFREHPSGGCHIPSKWGSGTCGWEPAWPGNPTANLLTGRSFDRGSFDRGLLTGDLTGTML